MKIRLWVREDRNAKGHLEEPKALPVGATTAKSPGRIFDVEAKSATDARVTLARALQKEPDKKADKAAWREWEDAMERVEPVTRTDLDADVRSK